MFVVFLLVVVVSRIIYQYTVIKDYGVRPPGKQSSLIAIVSSVLLLMSFVGIFALSLLEWLSLNNSLELVVTRDTSIGAMICLAGIGLISYSQFAMGVSWRMGVDESETTALVTAGIYRFVRNPIYTGVAIFQLGMTVMLPQSATIAFVLLGLLSIDLHVRYVEEPYLIKIHGERYVRYRKSTGAYWPKLFRPK